MLNQVDALPPMSTANDVLLSAAARRSDVLMIGGGPTGSTLLARQGRQANNFKSKLKQPDHASPALYGHVTLGRFWFVHVEVATA